MQEKKYISALRYDFLTTYYDIAIKITMPEKKFRKILVDIISPQTNERILEFGFGTGQNLILLYNANPKTNLEGLEIDPKVKAIAEYKFIKNNIQIPLYLYDGTIFPFTDNSFEKVYSCLVFHHLNAKTKLNCLKELYRVLKPNGKLIIADWGKARNLLMRVTFGLVQLLDGFSNTNDNVKGLIPNFISEAGFNNIEEKNFINSPLGTFSYYIATKTPK